MVAYTKSEKFYTEEEYLALERKAERKSEYFAGRIVAMSGASRRHNLINVNVTSELRRQLKGRPCEVYASDMRVRIAATRLFTYPDVTVVCGRPQIERGDNLTNPTVIIEILSPSTARYDRGDKFAHYQTLESLTDYILIAQNAVRIDHFVRGENNEWLQATATQRESVLHLASIDCDLALAEVYDKVDFSQEAEEE